VLARGGFLPRDAEAHDRYRPAPEIEELYVDAVYQLATRQQAGFERAIAGLTEATRRDPKFAAAFASLAEAYNTVSQFTPMPADQAYPLAEAAARQAIALDPDMAQAYAALAFTQFYWDRDFDRSRELFERAIALDPGSAQTRHWFALTRMMTGDFGVALREIAAAQRINPESRVIQANRALIRFHAGEVEQALTTLRLLADSEPKLRSPPEYLATIYLDRHDMPMFLREYRIAAGISGDEARSRIADAAEAGLRDGGEQGMLRAMFEAQQRRHAEAHEPAYKLAATAALLGETDTALSYLDEALAAREQDMLGVLIDPAFRSLRDDERYRRIVEAVGFHVSDKPVRAF
jgi:tetratricopeptide (TPR) repeat protein